MLTQSDLSVAIEDFARTAEEAIVKARRVVLPSSLVLSFSTSKLSKEDVDELARPIPTGGRKEDEDAEYIYVFRVAPSSPLPHERILEAFNAGRAVQETAGYEGKKIFVSRTCVRKRAVRFMSVGPTRLASVSGSISCRARPARTRFTSPHGRMPLTCASSSTSTGSAGSAIL